MCSSEEACLPADCFSELSQKKIPTKRIGLVQSGDHHLMECNLS
jgi:hypothetical protein